MNYHMIRTDDMLNGDGLRVVIFISGCHHRCDGCHNPETWDLNGGNKFTEQSLSKIYEDLDKEYISGITLSGGDPLAYENLPDVYNIVDNIKKKYPSKSIWLYTGYILSNNDFDMSICASWDNGLLRNHILSKCDVICDGKFIKSLADVNYPWVGSRNQRVIDVKKSLEEKQVVLYTK